MTHHAAEHPTTPVAAREPRAALIAAAFVAAILLLESLVGFLESFAWSPQSAASTASVLVPQLFAATLPKAAGVFLVLWLWPERPGERLLLVLARALAAAFAGCLLAIVVGFVVSMIAWGIRFADAGVWSYNPLMGLVSATVGLAPLVMLVVLVQRLIRRGARL